MLGGGPALGGSFDCRGTSLQGRIYPDDLSTSRQIPSQGIDLSYFISRPLTRGDVCLVGDDANYNKNLHCVNLSSAHKTNIAEMHNISSIGSFLVYN